MTLHSWLPKTAFIILAACFLSIDAHPFLSSQQITHEWRLFTFTVLYAQIAILSAWLVLGTSHWGSRVLWCGLGLVALTLIDVQTLGRLSAPRHFGMSYILGCSNTLAAMVPCSLILGVQRLVSGIRFSRGDDLSQRPAFRFGIARLLQVTAACAVLIGIASRMAVVPWSQEGREAPDAYLMIELAVLNFFPGMLIGPAALLVLRPSRWNVLWLLHFIVVCLAEPFVHSYISSVAGTFVFPVPFEWAGLPAILWDNVTWFGPALVPTLVAFGLLRVAGVRGIEPCGRR